MPGLGEEGIDLSFEDLEFIEEVNDETGEESNTETTEEGDQAATEDAATEGSEGTEQEAAQEAEDNDETIEGESPESVGGDSTEGDAEKQTSPQLYESLAAVLKEKGVLTSVDESSIKDIKDVDALVELVKSEIKAQELNDLTDTQKSILTGIRDGAAETTVTKFKDAMTKLDAIDEELIVADEKVQKDLIYQGHLSKGYSSEKAASLVDRSVKLGLTLEDAKEAHAELRTVVQSRYDSELAKEKATATTEAESVAKDKVALEKAILGNKEVIKGFDVPESTRKEVYQEMMENVSINPDTKEPENALMKFQRENPEEFTQKLYYLWKMSNGFDNLDYFKGKGTTSSVNALEKAIKNSTHIQGGGDPSYNDDINTGLLDIEDIIFPE